MSGQASSSSPSSSTAVATAATSQAETAATAAPPLSLNFPYGAQPDISKLNTRARKACTDHSTSSR